MLLESSKLRRKLAVARMERLATAVHLDILFPLWQGDAHHHIIILLRLPKLKPARALNPHSLRLSNVLPSSPIACITQVVTTLILQPISRYPLIILLVTSPPTSSPH